MGHRPLAVAPREAELAGPRSAAPLLPRDAAVWARGPRGTTARLRDCPCTDVPAFRTHACCANGNGAEGLFQICAAFSSEDLSDFLASLNPLAHVGASVIKKVPGCPCPRLLFAACRAWYRGPSGQLPAPLPGPCEVWSRSAGRSGALWRALWPQRGDTVGGGSRRASGSPGGTRGQMLSAGHCSRVGRGRLVCSFGAVSRGELGLSEVSAVLTGVAGEGALMVARAPWSLPPLFLASWALAAGAAACCLRRKRRSVLPTHNTSGMWPRLVVGGGGGVRQGRPEKRNRRDGCVQARVITEADKSQIPGDQRHHARGWPSTAEPSAASGRPVSSLGRPLWLDGARCPGEAIRLPQGPASQALPQRLTESCPAIAGSLRRAGPRGRQTCREASGAGPPCPRACSFFCPGCSVPSRV